MAERLAGSRLEGIRSIALGSSIVNRLFGSAECARTVRRQRQDWSEHTATRMVYYYDYDRFYGLSNTQGDKSRSFRSQHRRRHG